MHRQCLHFRLLLGLAFCCFTLSPRACQAQDNLPYDQNLQSNDSAQDVTGCPRLPEFPVLSMTVVESCQRGDSVELALPLEPDAKGMAQEKRVRGAYQFREYHIQGSDREYAFDNVLNLLPMIGFVVKYSNKPSTITARKGDTWMLVSFASESYSVSVAYPPQQSFTPVKTAEEIAREMKAHGQVDIYGIEFSPRDQSIQQQQVQDNQPDILSEVLKYLKANPDLSILIESHKFSPLGPPETDSEITRERANAVMDWLIAHGIARSRVQPRPCGRDNPIADNESPAGAQRNERIVLVKMNS